jgi:hypothetical protein
MINTIVRAEAVGARAASRYGSGSDQMMRLRLGNTAGNSFPQQKFMISSMTSRMKKILFLPE